MRTKLPINSIVMLATTAGTVETPLKPIARRRLGTLPQPPANAMAHPQSSGGFSALFKRPPYQRRAVATYLHSKVLLCAAPSPRRRASVVALGASHPSAFYAPLSPRCPTLPRSLPVVIPIVMRSRRGARTTAQGARTPTWLPCTTRTLSPAVVTT